MAEIHFLNVGSGDCIIIKHASGHITMMDICQGNLEYDDDEAALHVGPLRGPLEDMEKHPTNPLDYLAAVFPNERLFRFVLSHPDMDHLDGFDALMDRMPPINFWDSGVRRAKPDFSGFGRYREEDWDRYEAIISGRNKDVKVITPQAGSRFQYANRNENNESGGDGLYVLAPTADLVQEANSSGDFNDASYVLHYRSVGGPIVLPGDAHDASWEYVLDSAGTSLQKTSVLIAPHHGRRSDRVCDFFDVLSPQLTLFGCAPEKDMMYDECIRRELPYLTNNDAGNIVLEAVDGTINVFVQNIALAEKLKADTSLTNRQGYYLVAELADLSR